MSCAVDFIDAYAKLPMYQPFLEAQFKGPPSASENEYTSRSPSFWPEKIKVPLLLIQGGNDDHVPPGQVLDFVQKLKKFKVSCHLEFYPLADHLLGEFNPEIFNLIIKWFEKYKKGSLI